MNATTSVRVSELESQGKTAVYATGAYGRLPSYFAVDTETVDRDKAGHPVYVARNGEAHERCTIRDLHDISMSRPIVD